MSPIGELLLIKVPLRLIALGIVLGGLLLLLGL